MPDKKPLTWLLFLAVYSALVLPTAFAGIDITSTTGDIKTKYRYFENEVRDVVAIQQVSGSGALVKLKLYKKGERFRLEKKVLSNDLPTTKEEAQSMRPVIIYDGREAWVFKPLTGPERLPFDVNRDIEGYKTWWHCLSDESEVLDEEPVGGANCLVIRPDPAGVCASDKLWIDRVDFVLRKGERSEPDGQKITWVYSDFRKWKGRWPMPYRTDLYEDGQHVASYRVQSLEAGLTLPDVLFDVPSPKAPATDLRPIAREFSDDGY